MFDNSIHVASRLSARQIVARRIHAIILDESREPSGREPLYELIDDSEPRLTIWSAQV